MLRKTETNPGRGRFGSHTRFTKPQQSAAVPTIGHKGVTTDRHEGKARMLMDISFPPPTPYAGDECHDGPLGTAY